MNTFRFALMRLFVWLIERLSTGNADPADLTFCYRLLLDRPPDPPGWRQHMQFIRTGVARGTLVEGFLNSTEFQTRRGRSTVMMVDTGRFVMAVDSEDPHIAPGIIAGVGYEPHVTATLMRELEPESVFVDVGANMGWFSLHAAAIARQGQVIAIEPNYSNVQLLYRSLLANHFDNVRVLPYAVSDRPVRLRLNFFRSNGYVSPVEEENGTTAVVEGLPLDDLLGDVARIDVLKIDIEGYEPVALRGMEGTLRRCRPLLLCEFHPALIRANSGTEPGDFLQALIDRGYRLRVLHGDGSETAELSPVEITAEWQRVNAAAKSDGQLHLDLIGRPQVGAS